MCKELFRQWIQQIYGNQNSYYPLKTTVIPQVLGFAAFFALVLKKVEQEEFGEPQIDESLQNTGTFTLRFLQNITKTKNYIIMFLRSWQNVCSEKGQHMQLLSATTPLRHWEDEKQHD